MTKRACRIGTKIAPVASILFAACRASESLRSCPVVPSPPLIAPAFSCTKLRRVGVFVESSYVDKRSSVSLRSIGIGSGPHPSDEPAATLASIRLCAKGRRNDEDDYEDDEYEFVPARRQRGGMQYNDKEDYGEDEDDGDPRYYRTDEEDSDYREEYGRILDEIDLNNIPEAPRPLALDMVDPGRALDNWHELWGDKALIRDVLILVTVFFLLDVVAPDPSPYDYMLGRDVGLGEVGLDEVVKSGVDGLTFSFGIE